MKDFSEKTDESLIKLSKDGDNNAFSTLVTRHKKQVARTVIGMLGNCAEADDVGQETFVRFYKALPNFKGESAVSTYLTRIAINLSFNELKKRKRNKLIFFTSKDNDIEIDVQEDDTNTHSDDLKEAVIKAMQDLEPTFRSVIVLRMLDGYSTKETAEILDVPLGTVLSRLARAQEKLKEILTNLIN